MHSLPTPTPALHLSDLLQPLVRIKGIGTARRPLYERLLGPLVIDAVFHLPSDLRTRRIIKWVSDAKEGELVSIVGRVDNHQPGFKRGVPYKVTLSDGKRIFDVVFFNANPSYIERALPLGETRAISGKAEWYDGRLKIVHPDHMGPENTLSQWGGVEPIYPLTTGLTNRGVSLVVQSALSFLNQSIIPEWLLLVQRESWPPFQEALWKVHHPQSEADLDPNSSARLRLAYDEMLAHQLSLQRARLYQKNTRPGLALLGTGQIRQKLLHHLPFQLTSSQEKAFSEISHDMSQPSQMLRLVQGDVGCGKTLVAFLAMIQAVESGFQTAILAPTDILARQHGETLTKYGLAIGLRIALLTGRDKGKKREEILRQLREGEIDILIGTHAIIQDDVVFQRLGLAVVDEQHRFGVEQRLALSEKGRTPDILAMTATPIPRTMLLASYGDMDVSIIPEKPAQRLPIKTHLFSVDRLNEVIEGLQRVLHTNGKVFWVCPLVEESEALDLAAAESRFDELQGVFGNSKVGLIHGRLKAAEKDQVMTEFATGGVQILVSTTVIEVGVDVPDATVMIIEHAERFGLAQLHQLRGRIGRGGKAGNCLLIYGFALSQTGRRRLEIMRTSNDGFFIAEEDLKLRGGGEIIGTRQSGLPRFRFADFTSNPELYSSLLAKANKDAREIVAHDPRLETPRGLALQVLLRLFDKDNVAKYSRSG